MFEKMPNLGYIIDKRVVTVKDIFRRVAVLGEAINDYQLEHYTIQDGEWPEDVAYKLYGDPKLYWTILLVNNIIDPYNDWFVPSEVLEEFTAEKYGAEQVDSAHHWVLPDRPEVCVEYDAAKLANGEIIQISNKEHEELLNDTRQFIRVVRSDNIKDFVKDFEQKINV
jgi:hypothetical protein